MFNNFFIYITKSVLIKPINTKLSQDHKNVSFDEVYHKKIELSDTLDDITDYNDNTAAQLDKISVKVLKHVSNLVVVSLVYICIS